MAYPSTIVASNFTLDSGGGPVCDYRQDGTLWVAFNNQTDDRVDFYYSTDQGQTWTQAITSITDMMTDGNDHLAFFIDQDDNAHIVYQSGTGGASGDVRYRIGVANGLDWVWSSPISLTSPSKVAINGTRTEAVVAHREGTGWKAHCAWIEEQSGAIGVVYWATIAIDGSHIPTFEQRTVIKNWGASGSSSQVFLDFRHTQDDPKAVQASTPNVYVGYHSPAVSGILFKKLSYSAGTWSVGVERTIDANTQDAFMGQNGMVYDGTRVLFVDLQDLSDTVVRVWERDEADTTTTARDPTALADGIVRASTIGYAANGANADIWVVARGATSFDTKKIRFDRGAGTWGSWTVVEADTSVAVFGHHWMMRSRSSSGILGVVYGLLSASPDQLRFAKVLGAWEAQATLQGVATTVADAALGFTAVATLQGVATISPQAQLALAGAATLQGVATLDPIPTYTPKRDFTVHDLYIDDGLNVFACISHEDEQTRGNTRANPIRAEKQDVGQNPLEQRPEFGDYFAQGDFSHGSDQDYFHHVGRDERKYLASEGFDISEPGILRHLHTVAEAVDSSTIGRVAQAGGLLFVADGTNVKRGSGTLPGQWTNEDPHVGEGAQTVQDVASRGAEVFAALGSNGVHIRSSSGAWSHFRPDGATDLSVGTATKVRWLRDRLMVVGTGGREIFEVVADSTPIAIKTLPEGWTFQGVFEAGAFLYAPAVNADAGLSRVHIIGLNSTASALEDKGSVPIPRGELIYAGIGDPGGIFLGGGRRTEDGGYDPIFYQAFQGENGFLQLAKIAQGEGAEALDCSVRVFETLGEAIVFSWSTGSGAPTGARTGLGWYHLGRQAFSFHLRKTAPTGALVTDITFYNGVILFVVNGDGLYFEDTSTLVSEAYLISSMGDFGSAGLKSWDQAEVSHKELPSGAKATVQYTTKHVDEGFFSTALTSSTAGALGASSRFSDVKSSLFAVKLVSTRAGALSAPEIQTFSIRSNPTRPSPEFVLTRFIRVIGKDRKDPYAPEVFVDPVTRRIALQQLLDSWVTVYEPGITWVAFVKDVADTEPAEPFLSATGGERLKEAYIVRLDMVATGVAA